MVGTDYPDLPVDPGAHRPCHDAGSRWDEHGRFPCGCQVKDPPDCLVCETPFEEAHG